MSEADERFPVGPRGEQGTPGPRGERGLSRLQGRAVVVLFLVPVVLSVFAIFWVNYQVHRDESQNAQQHREQVAAQHRAQVAQQKAAAAVLAKLCTSLAKQAALTPPAGNPAANPSRAWEQGEHAILAQLGPDIGCRRTP